jgi:hypothetical protein
MTLLLLTVVIKLLPLRAQETMVMTRGDGEMTWRHRMKLGIALAGPTTH